MRRIHRWLGVPASAAVVISVVVTLPSASQAADRAAQGASFNFITSLLPATSAEFNSHLGQAWGDFERQVENRSRDDCLEKRGYTLPAELSQGPTPPPLIPDNYDDPNIPLLKSGSFGIPKNSGGRAPTAPSGIPASVRTAYQRDDESCENLAEALFAKVTQELKPIITLWSHDNFHLVTSPKLAPAMSSWRSCVAAGGVKVKTLNDFFGYVNSLIAATHTTGPTYSPEVQDLAKLYGKCIEPVSKAMDAARTKTRQYILNHYALQLDKIQRQMGKLVVTLSKKYGITTKVGN